MNAIVDIPRTAQRIPHGLEFTHSDPRNVEFFEKLGSVRRVGLQDNKGRTLANYHGLENAVTGELLNSPPISASYKLVNHARAFEEQAASIFKTPDLPHENFKVVDRIFDDGRRATRAVYFNDLTFDLDGLGQGITARADIINSVDMSWAFQVFSGAYRDYCRNTCVFGGQKAYQQRRKHTSNMSVESMIAKSVLGLAMFQNQREKMKQWRTIVLDRSQWVEMLENTVCKKGGDAAQLSVDKATRVNAGLLNYLDHRFNEEKPELGSTLWAAYNALTHWSTHVAETYERVLENGNVVSVQTGHGTNPHGVQLGREQKVRAVLDSKYWTELEGMAA